MQQPRSALCATTVVPFSNSPVLAGQKAFRDFLRSEYSEENILFWLACEDIKCESSPELLEEKARIIYEDYISILSPKEVVSLLMVWIRRFTLVKTTANPPV